MSLSNVSVIGLGLCTSLGGYADSCAAYRAGLNRFSAHQEMMLMEAGDDEPTPLTVAPAATNLWCYQRIAKLVKILHLAYLDLIERTDSLDSYNNLHILFAMPDPDSRYIDTDSYPGISREDRLQEYSDKLLSPLFEKMGPNFNTVPMQCVFGDRIAFPRILKKSLDLLSSGTAEHCLLITVDSLVDDETLELQLEGNLLKHSGNPVGYIPGEGGSMLLLGQQHNPQVQSCFGVTLSVVADIAASEVVTDETGKERQSPVTSNANKMAQLIRQLPLGDYSKVVFPKLLTDLNGSEKRAIDFGGFLVQLKVMYPDTHFLDADIPALSFGEVGSMSGPIALATVFAAYQRGYIQHKEQLVTLAEASGRCALILIRFSS